MKKARIGYSDCPGAKCLSFELDEYSGGPDGVCIYLDDENKCIQKSAALRAKRLMAEAEIKEGKKE